TCPMLETAREPWMNTLLRFFMGGKSTIVLHNTCEDSLLAAPLILDLVLLAELSTRIQLKKEGE
ncbi:hypothetical protein KI387_042616, partial [Taxus chinensis]